MAILNTSEFIIICYKRYSTIKNKLVKNTKDIKTPLILDLSKFVEDNKKNENKYSLCSAVYHIGNIRVGIIIILEKLGING